MSFVALIVPQYFAMAEGYVFYSGVITYQKLSHLIVGIVMAVVCVPLFISMLFSIPEILKKPSAEAFLVWMLCSLVGGGLGFVGCALVYCYVTKRSFGVRITSEGILLHRKLFPWSDVRAIGTEGFFNGRCQLVFHRMGRMPLDRHIQTDDGLSEEEFRHLMAELKAKIGPLHPNVTFVGGR